LRNWLRLKTWKPPESVSRPRGQLMVEVIRIAEDDFGTEGFQDVLGDGFDGSGCANGHEDGGLNGLVRKDELCTAAAGFGLVEQVELETHSTILDGGRSMEI
jgi:hypothetical protein